ncbi:hypothetical protein EVAR_72205_1 [Eumeta japonica]|uniref:Uncharacterized protein n=1 Tax=Eumeta variegata TaxID=151549 RepID=A0A4C1SKB6_EUMVA|nr:hypothetical protein EVAR_72205_1 [Eumeta japonica]
MPLAAVSPGRGPVETSTHSRLRDDRSRGLKIMQNTRINIRDTFKKSSGEPKSTTGGAAEYGLYKSMSDRCHSNSRPRGERDRQLVAVAT